jgi:hypothetical protein
MFRKNGDLVVEGVEFQIPGVGGLWTRDGRMTSIGHNFAVTVHTKQVDDNDGDPAPFPLPPPMDSLLAGYGSDSSGSGSSSGSAAAAAATDGADRATPPTTAARTSRPATASVADAHAGAASVVAADTQHGPSKGEMTDRLRETDHEEEEEGRGPKRPKLVPTPSEDGASAPTSSNVLRCCLPPPEVRDDEAAGATLVHWPKDYLTSLQQRAQKAIAASSASDIRSSSPATWGRAATDSAVAFELQNSHEFTNPHQLKDAAKRLSIGDALGSTLRTPT